MVFMIGWHPIILLWPSTKDDVHFLPSGSDLCVFRTRPKATATGRFSSCEAVILGLARSLLFQNRGSVPSPMQSALVVCHS